MSMLALVLVFCSGNVQSTEPIPGFTAPYRSVSLSAALIGTVSRVPVEDGQYVQAGDELVGLEDEVQAARAAMARLQSENRVPEQLAQVRLDQARAELGRLEALQGEALASIKEIADAMADARFQELNLLQATEERRTAALDLQVQQALLEQHTVRAPFAGFVTHRSVEVGQTTEVGLPLMQLVQLDPLLVVLECPLQQARQLTVGQPVPVTAGANAAAEQRSGTVTYVAPVANPASQTVRIKVSVANPHRDWLAGMKAFVHLPPVSTATDALVTQE